MAPKRGRNVEKEPRAKPQRRTRVSKQTEKGEFQRIELEKAQQRRTALRKKRGQAAEEESDKENHDPLEPRVVKHKHQARIEKDFSNFGIEDGEYTNSQSSESEDDDDNSSFEHTDLVEEISFQGTTYNKTPVVRVRRNNGHAAGLPRVNSSPSPDDPSLHSNISLNSETEIGEQVMSVRQSKRKHCESNLTNDEIRLDSEELPPAISAAEPLDACHKESGKKVKLAVKDLPVEEQPVLEKAQAEFQILVCTKNGFPESDPAELKLWAEECWENANDKMGGNFKLTKLTQRLITERVSTIRGRLRERAVTLVPGKYGFVLPTTDEDINTNKALAAKLLDNLSYIYKDAVGLKGMYEHPILAEIIVSQFFNKKRRSDGIVFSAAFNPIPESLIALVFTVVHFAIERWKSGTVIHKGQFTESEYHSIYQKHLNGIEKWKGFNDKTGCAFAKHQQRLFDTGSKFAGVDWENESETTADPFADDRIRQSAAMLSD